MNLIQWPDPGISCTTGALAAFVRPRWACLTTPLLTATHWRCGPLSFAFAFVAALLWPRGLFLLSSAQSFRVPVTGCARVCSPRLTHTANLKLHAEANHSPMLSLLDYGPAPVIGPSANELALCPRAWRTAHRSQPSPGLSACPELCISCAAVDGNNPRVWRRR